MLNVDFYVLENGKIIGFHIHGHCGYSDKGNDIVCSSVSSVVYMVANTITEILKINIPTLILNDGEMKLIIDTKDEYLCKVLFEGLKLHLIGLENLYHKNIKVNYTEV